MIRPDAASTRFVLGLGQASLDYLGLAPVYPERDAKCELDRLEVQGGGPVATALVTLSRLGLSTAFIGAVGDDLAGRAIRAGLIEEGVDVSGLSMVPGGTSQLAFIAVERYSGSRTIFWHRGRGTELGVGQVDLEAVGRARLLHLDGLMHEASMVAARRAREAGIPVVFDAGTLRDGSLDLAARTDCLICSERFFRAFHPRGDVEAGLVGLRELGPTRVVATFGARGSVGFDGRIFHHQPVLEVRVLDTTGAGDVYHGAFIYGLLAGWDLAGCMRFASATAALKCEKMGGRAGIPDLETVRRFMGPGFPGREPGLPE
ncbi:MAG: sugar kinase [Proteobacteria bacterium]|nr:sugar kinase [Pseudomonadota bacterium]